MRRVGWGQAPGFGREAACQVSGRVGSDGAGRRAGQSKKRCLGGGARQPRHCPAHGASNRMTVPSSVRMQLVPELGAGAEGGAAPAVPVNRGCGRFSRIRGKRPGMRPDRGGGRSGRLELERRGKRVHAPPLAYGAMTGQPFAADAGNAASVVRRDHPRPVLRPDAAAMAHLAGGLVTAADIGGENADALPAVDESRDARGQCRNAWRYCGNACRMLIHGLSVRYVRQARKQNRTLWTIIFRHFVR